MIRGLALLVAAAIVANASAQDDSSKQIEPDSFEVEPPLLIPNRDEEAPSTAAKASAPDADIAHLEKKLERAKRNAAGTERLCRIGALAKVEVEQRNLRVVRLESHLANARLALAKSELAARESQSVTGENSGQDAGATAAALARAIEAAHAAKAKLARAELDAAEANLRRQKKLLALGSARKRDVARAEQKIVELKQNGQ
jgi:hypothetical protein